MIKNGGVPMSLAAVQSEPVNLTSFIPAEVYPLDNPQTDLPRLARDQRLTQLIEDAVRRVPTTQQHRL